MKKIFFISALLLLLHSMHIHTDHPVRHVKQVVLWGHKLHSHTHSYIHWGFQRGYQALGYKTLWLDQRDSLANIDFTNSLFITEGQVDQGIPIRNDCYYVIHNCKPDKYRQLLANGHAIILQVYTHDCLKRNEPAFEFCFHYDLAQPIIYMPWATDLLPAEIDEIKAQIATKKQKNQTAVFIGTISYGQFGNQPQINDFTRACQERTISFTNGGVNSRSMEDNISLVQNALLAPAIQGEWQCRQGYIPCRIFKNISYGAMGITNSETVYKLFHEKILYDPNTYQLGIKACNAIKDHSLEKQYELMDFVRDHHTYLDRIERLFNFFEMVHNHKGL